MSKNIVRMILVIFTLISGCSENSLSSKTVDVEETVMPVIPSTQPNYRTTSSAPIRFPTATDLSLPEPASTKTTISTSRSIPIIPDNASLTIQCGELISSLPPDLDSTGIIVLEDFINLSPDGFLIQLDPKTGKLNILAESVSGFYPTVSPDRERLAYREVDQPSPENSKLVIMTGDGEKEREIPWQASWSSIVGWFDKEQIWMEGTTGNPRPLILLNPFTNQQTTFVPSFPNIYIAAPPFIEWGPFSGVESVYNSSLTQVVYPELEEGNGSIVVWDLQKSEVTLNLDTRNFYGSKPAWSVDGNKIILDIDAASGSNLRNASFEELYSVSLDGEIQRLTHLGNYFTKVSIAQFAWSPDERYIAFLIFAEPYEYPDIYPDTANQRYPRLAVYDAQTGKVTNFCIPADSVLPPIWSPDSHQLVLSYAYGDQPQDKRHVYLIDLQEKYAIRIAEDMQPIGWMKSP